MFRQPASYYALHLVVEIAFGRIPMNRCEYINSQLGWASLIQTDNASDILIRHAMQSNINTDYLTLGSGFTRFSGPLGMVFLQVQINLVGVSSPMLSY